MRLNVLIFGKFSTSTLQTHHVDSTVKRRGNGRFHVTSTWNPRGVLPENVLILFLFPMKHSYLLMTEITPDINNPL